MWPRLNEHEVLQLNWMSFTSWTFSANKIWAWLASERALIEESNWTTRPLAVCRLHTSSYTRKECQQTVFLARAARCWITRHLLIEFVERVRWTRGSSNSACSVSTAAGRASDISVYSSLYFLYCFVLWCFNSLKCPWRIASFVRAYPFLADFYPSSYLFRHT